jgi:Uma2 family endonuclease
MSQALEPQPSLPGEGSPLLVEKEFYTYADVLEWDEDARCEIMDGELYMMSAPTIDHQRISRNLFLELAVFLKGKTCEACFAPFSVRLIPEEDLSDDTVLEPDIAVVCDPSKLDKRSCNGPPDLIIEILSPSTARYDRLMKFHKYQEAGVREYWMVDPETRTIQVCILQPESAGGTGRYIMAMYGDTGTAPVTVLPGCDVDLEAVFAGAG